MRRALLNNAFLPLLHRRLRFFPSPRPLPAPSLIFQNLRRCSTSEDGARTLNSITDAKPPNSLAEAREAGLSVEDVSNAELKRRIELYFKGDEELLPSIFEAVLARKLCGKHEETDEELVEELRMRPLENVKDKDVEDDFEEMHDTDEEIDNLYNARDYVVKKLARDEFFNMDDKKWDDMIRESIEHGHLKDTKECEEILEDMLNWDKLLPVEIQEKVRNMYFELENMCDTGEIEAEQAYELFKKFEDKIVWEYLKSSEAEQPPEDVLIGDLKKNAELDDPPGEGPILRWESRIVFAPGGNAWHPKNRKVKLSVTVKEFGLSKHAFRRLRELVGKRYHSGRDELTIVSERFEHREENRKDCLRTLYALIEEAVKAEKFVEETRNSYMKDRLKANPQFMERLKAKVEMERSQSLPS